MLARSFARRVISGLPSCQGCIFSYSTSSLSKQDQPGSNGLSVVSPSSNWKQLNDLLSYAISSTASDKEKVVKYKLKKFRIERESFDRWCSALQARSVNDTIKTMNGENVWPNTLILQLPKKVQSLKDIDQILILYERNESLMNPGQRKQLLIRLLKECTRFSSQNHVAQIIEVLLRAENEIRNAKEYNNILRCLTRQRVPRSRKALVLILRDILTHSSKQGNIMFNSTTFAYLLMPQFLPTEERQIVLVKMKEMKIKLHRKQYLLLMQFAALHGYVIEMRDIIKEYLADGYLPDEKVITIVRNVKISKDNFESYNKALKIRNGLLKFLNRGNSSIENSIFANHQVSHISQIYDSWVRALESSNHMDGYVVGHFIRRVISFAKQSRIDGWMPLVEEIWADMEREGIKPILSAYASYIQALVMDKQYDEAFLMMLPYNEPVINPYRSFHPDIVCVNILMDGLNRASGERLERTALALWWDIQPRWNLLPDSVTLRIALQTAEHGSKIRPGAANAAWDEYLDLRKQRHQAMAGQMIHQLGIRSLHDGGLRSKIRSLLVTDHEESTWQVGVRIWNSIIYGHDLGPKPWKLVGDKYSEESLFSILRNASAPEDYYDDCHPNVDEIPIKLTEFHFRDYIHLLGAHDQGHKIPKVITDLYELGLVASTEHTLTPAVYYIMEAMAQANMEDDIFASRARALQNDFENMLQVISKNQGQEAIPTEDQVQLFVYRRANFKITINPDYVG